MMYFVFLEDLGFSFQFFNIIASNKAREMKVSSCRDQIPVQVSDPSLEPTDELQIVNFMGSF